MPNTAQKSIVKKLALKMIGFIGSMIFSVFIRPYVVLLTVLVLIGVEILFGSMVVWIITGTVLTFSLLYLFFDKDDQEA